MCRAVTIFSFVAIVSIYPVLSSAACVPDGTSQLVVVLSNSWDARTASLFRFERTQSGWKQAGRPVDAVLGGSGLAWGRGLHDKAGAGPVKKEGDRRAPAGMFRLLNAMGYDQLPPGGSVYPYVPIQEDAHCVDDPASVYYNKIVREADLPAPPAGLWRSSEILRRKDNLYKWLIVVDHNMTQPAPGAGSCIFLHVWRSRDKGTAGCTAMKESDLVQLITWLKQPPNPLLVQLPQPVYEQVWKEWKLPDPKTFENPR